jgi:hypothetical protein
MTKLSPFLKYCYYLKTKNYMNLTDDQIFDFVAHKLMTKFKKNRKFGFTEKEIKGKIIFLTDTLFMTTEGHPIPDMTYFYKRIKV